MFSILPYRPKVSSKDIEQMGRNTKIAFVLRPKREEFEKVLSRVKEMKYEYEKRKKSERKQRAMYAAIRVPLSTMMKITDKKIWSWEAMHWFDYKVKDGDIIIWWQGLLVGGVLADKNPSRGKAIDSDLKKIMTTEDGDIYFYDHVKGEIVGKYTKAKAHPFYSLAKKAMKDFVKKKKKKGR